MNITIDELKELALNYPNNYQLGEKVREYILTLDQKNQLIPLYDEWRITQFNRNRAIEDQVSTIEEMEKRVDEIFNS